MRKIWRKKVVAALLCAALTLGFVSPYDPIMSDFANRQLPKALLKNYHAWSVGAFWVLPDKKTLAACRRLYMQSGKLQTAQYLKKKHPEMPQCDSFYIFENAFMFTIPKFPVDQDNIPIETNFSLFCIEKGAGNIFADSLELSREIAIGSKRELLTRSKIGTSIEIVEQKGYHYNSRVYSDPNTDMVKRGADFLTSDGYGAQLYFDLPDLNFICHISRGLKFEKASRDLAATLVLLFTDKFRELESFGPTLPKLDTSVYQAVDLLLTTFIHYELLNPAVFKPQKWPGTTSVGGIAASSPEHALSLLSVRLSAIRPFLPAGLSGESVSDSKRQKHYSRGDGADASATI